jgi:hypothetical protein
VTAVEEREEQEDEEEEEEEEEEVVAVLVVVKSVFYKTAKAAAGWHLMKSHMIPLAACPQHLELRLSFFPVCVFLVLLPASQLFFLSAFSLSGHKLSSRIPDSVLFHGQRLRDRS